MNIVHRLQALAADIIDYILPQLKIGPKRPVPSVPGEKKVSQVGNEDYCASQHQYTEEFLADIDSFLADYVPLKKLKNVKSNQAIKHPNWSMGKKISIDSATMMNKIFEVIETQKIFGISKSRIKILIHEKSYVHAIIDFNSGLKKILVHDTNMQIPIFNTLYGDESKFIKNKDLDIDKMNNLNFKELDKKRFPLIDILKKIPDKDSLFETVVVSANDELVKHYLNKKISFNDLQRKLRFITNHKEFTFYKKKKPSNISKIYKLNDYVRLKIKKLCI